MARYYKKQVQLGVILVRITSLTVQGIAIMADRDDVDVFATADSKVALVQNRNHVPRFARPEVDLTPAMRGVLAQRWLHRTWRGYEVAKTQAMLDLPAQEWEWSRRAALLDRLEMAWTIAESLGDTATLERLKAKAPLGQLADLVYEPLSGDDAYRQALAGVDLDQARQDFLEISLHQDRQFIVLS